MSKEDNDQERGLLKEIIKDESLKNFYDNNPKTHFTENENCYEIRNCWGDDTFFIKIPKDEDVSILSNIVFPERLWAAFDKSRNRYEFFFLPTKYHWNLQFNYHHPLGSFHCYYNESSPLARFLAQHFDDTESDEATDRSISLYRYSKMIELPFTSFYIEGGFDKLTMDDCYDLFKSINFHMKFYCRKSPAIIIYDSEEGEKSKYTEPCISNNDIEMLPKDISCLSKIEAGPLDLYHKANSSPIRQAFLFYFQILEYYSYYYLGKDLELKLNSIIKSPDLLSSGKYAHLIVENFKNYFKENNDEAKIERLVKDFCTVEDIRNELNTNANHFVKDIVYDGKYMSQKLANKNDELFVQQKLISDLVQRFIRIRNVLVHARESRENKVIAPTAKNNNLLKPELFVLRRIVELIMIRCEL